MSLLLSTKKLSFFRNPAFRLSQLLLAASIFFGNRADAQIAKASCNTSSPWTNATYTNLVADVTDGVFSIIPPCLGSVSGEDNLVNSSTTDYASISMTGLACTTTISVADKTTGSGDVYPAGTYAGFKVSSAGLIGVSIGASVIIRTYNNGSATGDVYTPVSSGIGINSSLLNGDGSAVLGFVTSHDFDEITITYNALLGALFTAQIYYPVIEKFCDGPELACNVNTDLSAPLLPVVLSDHTGISGLVCAACSVSDASNLIDGTSTSYATIVLTAGVLSSGSVGVRDVLNVYPIGTFAGFDVENSSLIGVGLVNRASITTYLKGKPQESSESKLISLQLLSSTRQIIGFTTTKTFDEVVFSNGNLANVNLGTTKIYRAVLRANPICIDTDADGNPDVTDLDDDNDGITDVAEGGDTLDTDGDGIPNRIDLDSDNDGISDLYESGNAAAVTADKDGNGTLIASESIVGLNGIPNVAEGGTEGGTVPAAKDTDSDAVRDFLDLDSDNDGINDVIEGNVSGTTLDANGDGRVDGADTDGDGIKDAVDSNDTVGSAIGGSQAPASIPDTDGDGVKDFRDLDSDNDSINDVRENGGTDADGNGKADGTDTDGDGIPATADGSPTVWGDSSDPALVDTDKDGVPNFRDLDSDNDSINDVRENGGTDADGNGKADGTDTDGDGIPATADGSPTVWGDSSNPALVDTDGDGVPNFKDLDSDNDGINDVRENGGTDTDGNGLADGTDTDGDGIVATADGSPTVWGDSSDPALIDTDSDGIPNFKDLDSDNDGITDVRENGGIDIDGNGLADGVDTDGDGIVATVDGSPVVWGDVSDPVLVDTDGDTVPNVLDLDSDDDGINDVNEAGLIDLNGDGLADGLDLDLDGIPATADIIPALWGNLSNPIMPVAVTTTKGTRLTGTDTDKDGIRTEADGAPNVWGDMPPPLPVTLIAFNAQKENTSVNLTWSTSTETNSNRFEVQHSADAKQWLALGDVNAYGDSKVKQNYTFNHANPSSGDNYYRLKMIDNDESFAYSTIKTVSFDQALSLTLYPNPVSDVITLDMKDWSNVKSIRIYNLSGAAVYDAGSNIGNQIDVKSLKSGMYLLNVSKADGSALRVKFVVNH